MQLTQLRHAVALADEGSFSGAAERVHLTQPAFSRSIRALESSLGQRLFDRSSSGVRPTSVGALLLPQARALLRQANAIERDAALMRIGVKGKVAIGFGPMFVGLSRDLARRCWREQPAVFAQFYTLPIVRMTEMLLREELDFYVADMRAASGIPELSADLLATIPVGYCVRPGHPLAALPNLTLEDLRAFPLVSPALGGSGQSTASRIEWSGQLACEDLKMLIEIALDSDAVLMSNRQAIAPEVESGALVPLEVAEFADWTSEVALVRLSDIALSAAANRYADEARAIFAATTQV